MVIKYLVHCLDMQVLRMFHRKVHPENSMNAKDFIKSHKGKINNVPDDCCHEYDDGDPRNPEKSRFHSDTKSRKWSQHCKTNWKPIQDGVSCSSSTGKNEHWIKTDAECKYYILVCNLHTLPHRNLIRIYINIIISIHEVLSQL